MVMSLSCRSFVKGSGFRPAAAVEMIQTDPVKKSDISCAAESDGNVLALHDDRNLALSLRKFEHFFQPLSVFHYIDVFMVLVSVPGSAGIRSAEFSIYPDSLAH